MNADKRRPPGFVNRRLDFYSSVGGAAFLKSLLDEFRANGWDANTCHAISENQYRIARGAVGVLSRRWRMYGGYAWKCWRSARVQRDSLKVVTTNPFFAPWLVNKAAGDRGATINLVYDLFPDAMVLAGLLSENSWVARRFAAVTRRAFQDCAVSVFLGERLRRHAELRYGPARRAVVIPVGADGRPFSGRPPEFPTAGDEILVLYAGQMGRMHESETIGKTLASGVPHGIRFLFNASGAGYARLCRETPAGACEWGGPLADEKWRRTMLECHVALVTMALGSENIVMPSKAYSAMVAGQAIVAVCPRTSDLADLVRTHDCGWVVEPGNVEGLQRVLAEMVSDRDGLFRKRMNAFTAGHRHFDCGVVAQQWLRLFDEVMPLACASAVR